MNRGFGNLQPTVGVEYHSKVITANNKQLIKIQLYDTTGQEHYISICQSYYRAAAGVILVYDITS